MRINKYKPLIEYNDPKPEAVNDQEKIEKGSTDSKNRSPERFSKNWKKMLDDLDGQIDEAMFDEKTLK